jgi:hypothetical protein
LATRIWDLVLDGADELSSLAASLSSVVEPLEGHVNSLVTTEVYWGIRSLLVAACHTSRSWDPSWSCLGPSATQT